MKTIIRKGKSESALVKEIANEKNLPIEDIKYELISEGSKGFLGIGKKPAIIKFKFDEIKIRITSFIKKFFEKTGGSYKKLEINEEKEFIKVNINNTSEPGFYIGKRGSFLDNVEHLLNRMLKNKTSQTDKYIILDIDDYRKNNEKKILDEVTKISDKVRKSHSSIRLRPMDSKSRRIVHKYIETQLDLETITMGKGNLKRISIYLAEAGLPKKKSFKGKPKRDSRNSSQKNSNNKSKSKKKFNNKKPRRNENKKFSKNENQKEIKKTVKKESIKKKNNFKAKENRAKKEVTQNKVRKDNNKKNTRKENTEIKSKNKTNNFNKKKSDKNKRRSRRK